MNATLVDRGVEGILDEAVAAAPTTILVVNPGRFTVRQLIEAMGPDTLDVTVNLLADEAVLKAVMDDFLIASRAADLMESGHLEMRTQAGETENAVLVTDSQVTALISVDDRVTGLSTDQFEFVGRLNRAYAARWADAGAFSLRTPPLSRVDATLGSDIGDAVRTDFAAVLRSLETARGDGNGLDEVTISLLVAAKNEALLYDISKWGEDVGIASKATFSRTKTYLEEQGLIDTEKVPIEVGRPRLRLKLSDERLREADADELANVALTVLR